MNKKGFTLIELIGVVVILALIFLLAFPSLNNTIARNKDAEYNQMVDDLCLAGKSYINSNSSIYDEDINAGNRITINISTLIDYGNVKDSTINPKTKKSIRDDKLEFDVSSDKTLICNYKG